MNPLILLGGLAGIGALAFFGHRSTLSSDGIDVRVNPGPGTRAAMPADLLSAMTAAVRSGSAAEMRRVAIALRAAGFAREATELERAAREVVHAPPEQTVIEVDEPPAGTQPVTGPGDLATTQPIEVDEPPPGAQPVPSPSDESRRIPAGTDTLAADYARMVYASAPRGPVLDLSLSDAFKQTYGVRGDKKFYGAGPALALIRLGVVPPTPWDWQKSNPSQDRASYRRQLGEAKRNDPSRTDLWDQAIAAVS